MWRKRKKDLVAEGQGNRRWPQKCTLSPEQFFFKCLLNWLWSFKWFLTMHWWFIMRDTTNECIYRYVIRVNKMPTRWNRWFLLQILLLAQHVSGAPLCPSSGAREYYTGDCCLSYLVLWFSSCRYGVELRVMCPKHQIPQAATSCIILSSSWWWA